MDPWTIFLYGINQAKDKMPPQPAVNTMIMRFKLIEPKK